MAHHTRGSFVGTGPAAQGPDNALSEPSAQEETAPVLPPLFVCLFFGARRTARSKSVRPRLAANAASAAPLIAPSL